MIIIAGINLIMHTSRIDEQIISNRDKHITSTPNAITRSRRIRVRVQIRVRVGTSVVGHVVDVEGADVREEVLVGEGVVGRRDAVSSHAEALPKNLIAPHPYRFTRGGVPEAYC
jgi:hypothetical protein